MRMSLYPSPPSTSAFHFSSPIYPPTFSTQRATSYMLCKELHGSNVQHLVFPYDRHSCKYAVKDFAARTCLFVATSTSPSTHLRSI